MRTIQNLLGVLFVLFASLSSRADIHVLVNGVPQGVPRPPGTPITITDIDVQDAPTPVIRINVYADDEANEDIGRITISGSVSFFASLATPVHLIIGENTIFPIDPTLPQTLAIAGRHWDGVVCADEELRKRIRLAGRIAGNLRDSIEVGRVFRVHVEGDAYADITATGAGVQIDAVGLRPPVDHVYIGRSFVRASPTAAIPRVRATSSLGVNDVANVSVGELNPQVSGIFGSILAPYGEITSIRSYGPITIPLTEGSISAGSGIDSLIAAAEDDGVLFPQDIDARIEANAGNSFGDLLYLECDDLRGTLNIQEIQVGGVPLQTVAMKVHGDILAPIRSEISCWGRIEV